MIIKPIDSMTGEGIVNANIEVDERLEEVKRLYKPFEGRRFDELSEEEAKIISDLMTLTQKLVYVKAELRRVALYKFKVLIF